MRHNSLVLYSAPPARQSGRSIAATSQVLPVTQVATSPHNPVSQRLARDSRYPAAHPAGVSQMTCWQEGAMAVAAPSIARPINPPVPLPAAVAQHIVLLSRLWDDTAAMINNPPPRQYEKEYPATVARRHQHRQTLLPGVTAVQATLTAITQRLRDDLLSSLTPARSRLLASIDECGFIATLMNARNGLLPRGMTRETVLNILMARCHVAEWQQYIGPLVGIAECDQILDASARLARLDGIYNLASGQRERVRDAVGSSAVSKSLRQQAETLDTLATNLQGDVLLACHTLKEVLRPLSNDIDRIMQAKPGQSVRLTADDGQPQEPAGVVPDYMPSLQHAADLHRQAKVTQFLLDGEQRRLAEQQNQLRDQKKAKGRAWDRVKSQLRSVQEQRNPPPHRLPNPVRSLFLAPPGNMEQPFRDGINNPLSGMQQALEDAGFYPALATATIRLPSVQTLQTSHHQEERFHSDQIYHVVNEARWAQSAACFAAFNDSNETARNASRQERAERDAARDDDHYAQQNHQWELNQADAEATCAEMRHQTMYEDALNSAEVAVVCEDSNDLRVRVVYQRLAGDGEHVTQDSSSIEQRRFAIRTTKKQRDQFIKLSPERQQQWVAARAGVLYDPGVVVSDSHQLPPETAPIRDGQKLRRVGLQRSNFTRTMVTDAPADGSLQQRPPAFNTARQKVESMLRQQAAPIHTSPAPPALPLPITYYHPTSEAPPAPIAPEPLPGPSGQPDTAKSVVSLLSSGKRLQSVQKQRKAKMARSSVLPSPLSSEGQRSLIEATVPAGRGQIVKLVSHFLDGGFHPEVTQGHIISHHKLNPRSFDTTVRQIRKLRNLSALSGEGRQWIEDNVVPEGVGKIIKLAIRFRDGNPPDTVTSDHMAVHNNVNPGALATAIRQLNELGNLPALSEQAHSWLMARLVSEGRKKVARVFALSQDEHCPDGITLLHLAVYNNVTLNALANHRRRFNKSRDLPALSPQAQQWLDECPLFTGRGKLTRIAIRFEDSHRPGEIKVVHLADKYDVNLEYLVTTLKRRKALRNLPKLCENDQRWLEENLEPAVLGQVVKLAARYLKNNRPEAVTSLHLAAYNDVIPDSLRTTIRTLRTLPALSSVDQQWIDEHLEPDGAEKSERVANWWLHPSRPKSVSQAHMAANNGLSCNTLRSSIHRIQSLKNLPDLAAEEQRWLDTHELPEIHGRIEILLDLYLHPNRPQTITLAHMARHYQVKLDSLETAHAKRRRQMNVKPLQSAEAKQWLARLPEDDGTMRPAEAAALFFDPRRPQEVEPTHITNRYKLMRLSSLLIAIERRWQQQKRAEAGSPPSRIKQEPEEHDEAFDEPEIVAETLLAIRAERYAGPLLLHPVTGRSVTVEILGNWMAVGISDLERLPMPAAKRGELLAYVQEAIRSDGDSDTYVFKRNFTIRNDPDDPVGNKVVAIRDIPLGTYLGLYAGVPHLSAESYEAAIRKNGQHAIATFSFATRQSRVIISGYENPNPLALINTANLPGYPPRGENNVGIFYVKRKHHPGMLPGYFAQKFIRRGEELLVPYGPHHTSDLTNVSANEAGKNDQIKRIAEEKTLNIVVVGLNDQTRICTPTGWLSASIGDDVIPVDKMVAIRARQNRGGQLLYDALRMPEQGSRRPANWTVPRMSRDNENNLFDALARGISYLDPGAEIAMLREELSELFIKPQSEDSGIFC